jgi:hypothetical protein
MDNSGEPELPLEPTPAINWVAIRKRACVLVTAPKIPAWAAIALLVIREIPDWKSRYDFWLAAAKSLGGLPAMIAALISSPFFGPTVGLFAAAYIVLIGEPKNNTQRHHWWPYLGWTVFGLLATAIIVTGITGYVEIYIKEEVGKRDVALQNQASVHPILWHMTDEQRTKLGAALDEIPKDKRFPILIRCMSDSGSRTFAEYFAKIVSDHDWKFSGNCLFSDVRPDLIGVVLGVAKKHAGKPFADLPEHIQMAGKLLQDANINGQWGLDRDDNLADEPAFIFGNPPSSEIIGSPSATPPTSP